MTDDTRARLDEAIEKLSLVIEQKDRAIDSLVRRLDAEIQRCDQAEMKIRALSAPSAVSPEAPPMEKLVLALQAHAKEHGWQDVDEPIAALLAWPAGSVSPEAVRDGWQPIATAPKDGTWIAAWCNYPSDWSRAPWVSVVRWSADTMPSYPPHWYGLPNSDYQPTHWMPLPEPPGATGNAAIPSRARR
jgi:hypothetical protein